MVMMAILLAGEHFQVICSGTLSGSFQEIPQGVSVLKLRVHFGPVEGASDIQGKSERASYLFVAVNFDE